MRPAIRVALAGLWLSACSPFVDADRFEFRRDAGVEDGSRDGGDASGDDGTADAALPTRDGATEGGTDAGPPDNRLACSDGEVDATTDLSFMTAGGDDRSANACGGRGAPDQQFVFRPEISGWYTIETVDASHDVVLSTADACGTEPTACKRDATRADALLARKLEAGEPTLISIDGFSVGEGGAGLLRVRPVSCPDQTLGTATQVLSTASGVDADASPCGGAGFKERALVWTSPEDGFYSFRAQGDGFLPVLSMRDGPLCQDERLTCARGKGAATLFRFVPRGQSRTLIVDGFDGAGDVELSVRRIDDPAISCPARTITEGVPEALYRPLYGSIKDEKLESWLRNDHGAGEIGDTRTLGASCAEAGFADGRAYGDVTFAFTLPALIDQAEPGHCQIGVSSLFPVALAVHEGTACGGSELGCSLSAYAEPVDSQWTGISMPMRKTARPLTLSVARAAVYPKVPFRFDIDIFCLQGSVGVAAPGPVQEVSR